MSKIHDVSWDTTFQRAVAVGMLLGDGSLSKPSNGINYHLSCYHAAKQLDWLTMKHQWLGDLSRPIQLCAYTDKRDGKTRHGGRFHTISAPIFTELYGLFYPGGRKTMTESLMQSIAHPVTLAVLIGDDGYWDRAGVQIATKQFSEEESLRLAARLVETFGIQANVRPNKPYHIIRLPGDTIPKVTELCLGYLPPTLHYKLGGGSYQMYHGPRRVFICQRCSREFTDYAIVPRVFCSRTCNAGMNWRDKGRRLERTCKHCGSPFITQRWQDKRYCTRECYVAARRQT